MSLIVNLLINSLAVFLTSRILPGIALADFVTAIVVALVLGIVNTIIKPALVLLTLPINVLTLGLFTLVINALIILLVAAMVPGFKVSGFWAALLFSLVLSVISGLLHSLNN